MFRLVGSYRTLYCRKNGGKKIEIPFTNALWNMYTFRFVAHNINKWRSERELSIRRRAMVLKEERVHWRWWRDMCVTVEGGHVNKWPTADGERPALLCKAAVSSWTRTLNMLHRWLIKPAVSLNGTTYWSFSTLRWQTPCAEMLQRRSLMLFHRACVQNRLNA